MSEQGAPKIGFDEQQEQQKEYRIMRRTYTNSFVNESEDGGARDLSSDIDLEIIWEGRATKPEEVLANPEVQALKLPNCPMGVTDSSVEISYEMQVREEGDKWKRERSIDGKNYDDANHPGEDEGHNEF